MVARRVGAKIDLRIHEGESAESVAAAVKERIERSLPGKDGEGHYFEDVRVTVGAADVRDDKGDDG